MTYLALRSLAKTATDVFRGSQRKLGGSKTTFDNDRTTRAVHYPQTQDRRQRKNPPAWGSKEQEAAVDATNR